MNENWNAVHAYMRETSEEKNSIHIKRDCEFIM